MSKHGDEHGDEHGDHDASQTYDKDLSCPKSSCINSV